MTFADIAKLVDAVPTPKYESKWSGVYLLHVGAAYSLGCAELVRNNKFSPSDAKERWRKIRDAIAKNSVLAIEEYWASTYFLTNALFRIWSAIEKTSTLCHPSPPTKTSELLDEFNDAKSWLSRALPQAHAHLKNRPETSKKRSNFLSDQRQRFKKTGKVDFPIKCLWCLWNKLKHEALPPDPSADFYWELATSAFSDAIQIYQEAKPFWESDLA